jgi:LysM repeat protein
MRTVCVLAAVGMLGSGCGTVMVRQDDWLRQQEDVDRLQADVTRLQGQVSELSQVQQRMLDDVGSLQRDQGERVRAMDSRLGAVERSVGEAAGERERLRQTIVSDVSQKVSTLIRTSTPPAPAARSETGYEHVVKSGETLSAIASAYKVSVNKILQANGMKDANMLRVGQKLFIPER